MAGRVRASRPLPAGQCVCQHAQHSFMSRHVHPSFGRVKTNMDGQKYGRTGKKMKEQKSLRKP